MAWWATTSEVTSVLCCTEATVDATTEEPTADRRTRCHTETGDPVESTSAEMADPEAEAPDTENGYSVEG